MFHLAALLHCVVICDVSTLVHKDRRFLSSYFYIFLSSSVSCWSLLWSHFKAPSPLRTSCTDSPTTLWLAVWLLCPLLLQKRWLALWPASYSRCVTLLFSYIEKVFLKILDTICSRLSHKIPVKSSDTCGCNVSNKNGYLTNTFYSINTAPFLLFLWNMVPLILNDVILGVCLIKAHFSLPSGEELQLPRVGSGAVSVVSGGGREERRSGRE